MGKLNAKNEEENRRSITQNPLLLRTRTQFSRMEPAAMWEDFKIGVEHLSRWERVAVVTDVDWIRHALNIFRFLMPGEVRVFGTSEAAAARRGDHGSACLTIAPHPGR